MTPKSSHRDASRPAGHSPETRDVVIQLNAEDSLAFAQALLNPREPNQELRAAVRRYREMLGNGSP